MSLKLFLISIVVIIVGVFIWLIITSSPWIQRYRILFWSITFINFFVVGFIVLFMFVSALQNQAPPEPEITYGEFPFRLEYEVNGEQFVIEDTIIAEFIGSFRGNMTTQPRRSWNISLLNDVGEGKHREFYYEFLLKENEDVRIAFTTGTASYFMGDIGSEPTITVNIQNNVPAFTRIRLDDAHKLLAEHGIILINWEYTPPIENRFE